MPGKKFHQTLTVGGHSPVVYCLRSVTTLSLHLPLPGFVQRSTPSPGSPCASGKWPHSLPHLGGPHKPKGNLIPLLVSTNEVWGPTRSKEQIPGSLGLMFDLLWDRINGRKRLYGTSGPRAPGCCAENTTYSLTFWMIRAQMQHWDATANNQLSESHLNPMSPWVRPPWPGQHSWKAEATTCTSPGETHRGTTSQHTELQAVTTRCS